MCTIVQDSRLSRPVNAIINGTTAYILNCGFECGGTLPNGSPAPASVAIFDLGSLSITQTVTVDAATMALLNGSTLYVAGTPANNPCPSSQNTAATNCGTLDVVDLSSMQVTSSAAITDGYHDRMDMTTNGQAIRWLAPLHQHWQRQQSDGRRNTRMPVDLQHLQTDQLSFRRITET